MSRTYLDDMSAIWEMVRESFHTTLSRETIDLWFKDITVVSFDQDTITLATPSNLKCKIIKEHHLANIQKGFCDLLGFNVRVEVISTAAPDATIDIRSILKGASPSSERKAPEQPTQPVAEADLREAFERYTDDEQDEIRTDRTEEENEPTHAPMPSSQIDYTFSNFIIGNSNKFAHAACFAVADRPAVNYNPLFIYGSSGLGKTHLMYAIINELRRKNPNINIIYIKGDEFTNQLVDSIKHNAQQQFRDKYRKCDVLLIDDIQFIAGKDSTQEEFFHTFNALYEEHKQIILTSDRPPRDIKTLEDRLKTRFEWGLIADIQPPDFELRIAIIKKKAEQIHIKLPDDVINFLAENLRSNIRQIEGAIKKLGAFSFLSGKELNLDLARSCIIDISGGAEPVTVTVDKIFAAIQKKYNVKREEIEGSRRTKEIAWARHVTIYLIRSLTDMSFPNIGKIFNRDHSTIMSSIDTIDKRIRTDNMFLLELNELKKEVSGKA